MPKDDTVRITEREIEEFSRILKGLKSEIQNLKEERQSEATVQLIRHIEERAISDDSVTATEDTSPTMTWDSDAWDYAEWGE